MSAKQKGSRKVGRNKITMAAYKGAQTREFNKARRLIKKVCGAHKNDKTAWAALVRLDGKLFAAQRKQLGTSEVLKQREAV